MQLEGKFIRIAHDPGDPQITSHCPFCGSGQVTGRSDGTIDCAFCGMNYIVRVQPAFPGMPQQPMGPGALTDIGPEMGPMGMDPMMGMEDGPPGEGMPPGMEGGDEGGFPPGEDEDAEGSPFGPEDDEEDSGGFPPGDDSGGGDEPPESDKKPPKSKKKGSLTPGQREFYKMRLHIERDHGYGGISALDATPGDRPGAVHPHEAIHALHDALHRAGIGHSPAEEAREPAAPAQSAEPRNLPAVRQGSYRTLAGDALPEEAYVRHLAVLHSGGTPSMLARLRKEAALPHEEMGPDGLRYHMRAQHGFHDSPDDPDWLIDQTHRDEHADFDPGHSHSDLGHEHDLDLHRGDKDWLGQHGIEARRREANSPDAEARAVPRGQHQWLYPVPGSYDWQPSTGGLEHRAHARRCAACDLEARAYPGPQGGLEWRYARSTDYQGKPEREHGDLSQCPGRPA